MKLRNTAIALGIGAATATGLSLLKVNKDLVVGSTAVVVGAGLMIALKDKEDSNNSSGRLTKKELLDKIKELGDVSKSDLVRECGYVGTKKDGGERLYYTAFYEALLEAKGVSRSAGNSTDFGEDFIEDEEESLGDDTQQKIKKYTELINNDPDNAENYIQRANINDSLGEYEKAIQDYDKALDIKKDSMIYLYRGATKWRHKVAPEEVLKDYDKAIEIDSKNHIALKFRGELKYHFEDYEGVINDFKNVVEIEPKGNLILYVSIGNLLDDLGNYDEAISSYGKAIEIDSDFFPAYYHRGYAKSKHGDYEGAINDFSKTLELDPYNDPNASDVFRERGKARKELGDLKGACEDWKEGINELDDDSRELFDKHCEIYLTAQDYVERVEDEFLYVRDFKGAIGALNTAEKNDIKDSRIFNLRGIAKLKLNQYEDAILDFTKAIEINSECISSFYYRGEAKEGLGNIEDAKEDWVKTTLLNVAQDYHDPNKDPYYKGHVLIGKALLKLGEVKDACEYLDYARDMGIGRNDEINELMDKHCDCLEDVCVFLERGNQKKKSGDLKGACEDWKKATDLGDEDAAKLVEEHCK